MADVSAYDYIIVGSGTSGAIAACLLQEAGAKCLLLESGRHFKTEEFPLPESEYTPQMYWGGGAEFNTNADLAFLRGKCVGGGSVINGALMDRFDDVALNDFKNDSGVDFFTEAALDAHYTFAEENIGLQTIPDEHRNNNAKLFIKAMDNCGHTWKPLRRCQTDCATDQGNDCISCLGGCHRRSKQTMMDTYVPRAERAGLEVRDFVHIDTVEHAADGVTLHGTEKGAKTTFRAPKVILAMGAFGTTQVLLNSNFKSKFAALGSRFAMHPQFMNFAIFDEPIDSHKGVLQGVKSLDPEFRKKGFKLENVFAPPVAIAVLLQKTGMDLQNFMMKYRNLACIEVAVRDENLGTLSVKRNGRLQIHKRMSDQDTRRRDDGMRTVHEMFASLQPREIVHCPWGFGLHLMGGCRIGTDGADAVVCPTFQLHDHPNLYVGDSSIFPNAPGINPALTIMALTHRMTQGILSSN